MMKPYSAMSRDELVREKESLAAIFAGYKAKGISLNMARGKPGKDQLALSMPMLDLVNSSSDCIAEGGVD
jgi:hypothetical protein